MVGVAAVVHAVAARRSHWDAQRATRNLSLMLVGVIAVISVLATRNTVEAWRRSVMDASRCWPRSRSVGTRATWS